MLHLIYIYLELEMCPVGARMPRQGGLSVDKSFDMNDKSMSQWVSDSKNANV